MPYSNYDYLNPIHIVWREGTPNDPYIERIQYLKVVNSRVVLSEIPDRSERVKIAGLREINYDGMPKKALLPDEFSVDYSTGIIEIHSSLEAKSVNVRYKGRGFVLYPSTRIYHQDGNNSVVETLHEIIERAKEKVEEANQKMNDYIIIRNQVMDAIAESQKATLLTNKAIQDAESATKEAQDATEDAIDAYNSTIMHYQPPVPTFNDIATTYPNPTNGMRVMVTSTGDIYRYDGILDHKWELIDNYAGGSVPVVNDQINGLMRKEDFTKMHQKLNRKSILFVLPQFQLGIQKPLIKFPMDGEIEKVYAYCSEIGSTVTTKALVEKVSEADFLSGNTWRDCASFDIDPNAKESTNEQLKIIDVLEGDFFRINVTDLDDTLKGITIQIDIII